MIPWIIADIILGAALLCSPQLERTFFSLSHVSSPLWYWNMCGTSLQGCPQSLRNAGEGHDPLIVIFLVGSSLAASLAAHLSYL